MGYIIAIVVLAVILGLYLYGMSDRVPTDTIEVPVVDEPVVGGKNTDNTDTQNV